MSERASLPRRRWRSFIFPITALALHAAVASADTQCPASKVASYSGLSKPWGPSSPADELRINLPVEKGRHYKRLTMTYDMQIGSWGAGADYYPISWVRNLPYDVDQQFDWFLIRKKSPHQIISLETEALNWNAPATWKENTKYAVSIVHDAEAGTHTTTAVGGGVSNEITRPATRSILPGKQGVVLIFSFKNPAAPVAAPVGWQFSNLKVDLEPGGPFGPDALPCPGGLAWATKSVPEATQGVAYGPVQLEATNGTPPLQFSLEPGAILPPGMTLSAAGALGGTPTQAGSFPTKVRVSDGGGAYAVQTVPILVSAPPLGGTGGAGGSGTAGSGAAAGAQAGGSAGTAPGSAGAGWSGGGGIHGNEVPGASPSSEEEPPELVEGTCACRAAGGARASHWLPLMLMLASGCWRRQRRVRRRTRGRTRAPSPRWCDSQARRYRRALT